SGTVETIFGDVPYKPGDYIVIPRGTTYRFVSEGPQRRLVFESPGLIEIPSRYRNEYGQLLEHAPYYTRDLHPPTELHTYRDTRGATVHARYRRAAQRLSAPTHDARCPSGQAPRGMAPESRGPPTPSATPATPTYRRGRTSRGAGAACP